MHKLIRGLIFLVLVYCQAVFFTSCKKEIVTVPPSSMNYFPTETGKWVQYRVDTVYHGENDNLNDDSVYYFHCDIMEVIDSAFTDGSGRETQVVNRYYRKTDTEDWQLINVWTQYLTPTSAYRTENNIPLHKLAFPINSEISWNGNDANSNDEQIFSYEYFHEPGTIGIFAFDSTLSVLQIDEDNYIEKIYGNEIYATGIGLIYKQYDNLGKINGIVVSGYETRMTITDFGSN